MTFLSRSDIPVSVLDACDTALEHAVNSRKKQRGPTSQEFDNAIRKLCQYEKHFHPR